MPISQSPESMMKSHSPRCCPVRKSPWPPFIPRCSFMRRRGKPTWRTKDHPRLCVMKLLSRWAGSVLPLETELQPLWEQGSRRPRPSLATPLPEHCKYHIPACKQSRKPSVVGHSLYSTTFVFLVRLVDTFPNSSNPSYENNKTHSLKWHLTNSFTSPGI